jgi:hypothetical protein
MWFRLKMTYENDKFFNFINNPLDFCICPGPVPLNYRGEHHIFNELYGIPDLFPGIFLGLIIHGIWGPVIFVASSGAAMIGIYAIFDLTSGAHVVEESL